MATDQPTCRIDADASSLTVFVGGRWQLSRLAAQADALAAAIADRAAAIAAAPAIALDGSALEAIDTASALQLWRRLAQAGADPTKVTLAAFDPRHQRILDLVRERLGDVRGGEAPHGLGAVARLGLGAVEMGRLIAVHVSFLGIAMASLGRVAIRPRSLRRREFFAQLSQTCLTAIPVVSLVMFLIGVVVAYLLGMQAEQYGANIFVVDGVSLGMVREFSPLLVATIVAGRSGAAFTAQLGTMKLTEEIDAIRTLGLPVDQVLLVPRVLALVLALPVLVFVGNVLGLAGAAMICAGMLDITPATFVDRLHEALAARHYAIGMAKAPVFALFIAVIGCSMGLTVNRDTRSIGINTTSTVVQSIVVVILLDAFFAVLFQELAL